MNEVGTAVLEMPKEVCAPSEIGALAAFFEPSVAADTDLVRSDERLIGELVSVLERQLLAAVDARSNAEFLSVRQNVWPKYARALRALQDTVSVLVSDQTVERIMGKVLPGLAADLQRQESRLGSKLSQQAVFTLWAMPKIRALARELSAAGDVRPNKRKEDLRLLSYYHAASLWAQFHLDAIFAAIKFGRPICEEIRESVCDGLRAAVNAYAYMKEALLLRRPDAGAEEPQPAALPWDEEDEQLLALSMRDVDADFSAGS